MHNSPSNELQVAIEAAKIGAKVGLKYYNKKFEVKLKIDETPVTLADIEAEEVIREYILSKFPGANIVGEEGGGNKEAHDFWTVDPIDGTISYSRGIPMWCVLISLYRDDSPILGVCYFPVLDLLYVAERGKGAYLNGKKIYVSKIGVLSESLLAHGNIKRFKNRKGLMRLCDEAGNTRSPDPTYGVGLVSEGKIDVVIHPYVHIWDTAPFEVIIPEAGGKITATDGKPIAKREAGFIATNGILHDEVVRIYNEK